MKILIDTSVWINHLRKPDSEIERLLAEDRVVTHPFILGELALGSTKAFGDVEGFFRPFDRVSLATSKEMFTFIKKNELSGTGIGLVDAYLLAGCLIDGGTKLLTADKKLAKIAHRLGVGH